MNPRHGILIALTGAVLILQGCGGGEIEQLKTAQSDSDRTVTVLKSELETARNALSRQEVQNQQLNHEVQELRKQIGELEDSLAKAQAEKKEFTSKEPVDQSKVSLLGAKALAEHKAARLSDRVDRLAGDLDRKEQALVEIKQAAEQKDQEIASLRATLDKLQRGDQARAAEVDAKLAQLTKDASERAAEAQRLKKELEDKSILLETLKEAVTDAGRLKKTAESEVARLQGELRENSSKLEKTFSDVEQLSGEVASLKGQLQKAQNETARVRKLRDQTRDEKDHYHAEAAKFQLEAERLGKEVQGLRAALDETNARLQDSYGLEDQAQQEIATLKAAGEQSAENQRRLQTLLDQSQEDKVHYHEQATKLRLEVERRTQEAQELRIQLADLSARIKELEQAVSTQEEPEGPSPVDRLLEPPVKRGETGDRPRGLF